jgi:hypothetical protein
MRAFTGRKQDSSRSEVGTEVSECEQLTRLRHGLAVLVSATACLLPHIMHAAGGRWLSRWAAEVHIHLFMDNRKLTGYIEPHCCSVPQCRPVRRGSITPKTVTHFHSFTSCQASWPPHLVQVLLRHLQQGAAIQVGVLGSELWREGGSSGLQRDAHVSTPHALACSRWYQL